MRACFIRYPIELLEYYFYFPEDYNMFMSWYATFLKKWLIHDGGSGRQIKLGKKIFEEQ